MSDAYFEEIESHFARRRGTPFVLNAKDWALMKQWRDDGIPLAVVIEAVDAVFDRNEERGNRKVVSSLSYCRHAVKELWADRKELFVGGSAETPEESVGPALAALASALEGSPEPLVRRFAPRVRELEAERSVPRIEERLMDLEEEMIGKLVAELPGAAALRDDAASMDLGRVDEATRARTVEANLRRLVRERYALPRLTLFQPG